MLAAAQTNANPDRSLTTTAKQALVRQAIDQDAAASAVAGDVDLVRAGREQAALLRASDAKLGAAVQTAAATTANAPRTIQVVATSNKAKDVILTSLPNLNAPNSSLFVLHPEPGVRYLVETDPRFTNYKNFLSSDYMLTQLQLDPANQLKRYGDGFFEQQQVNDQILALTGKRYLSGYTNTEAEYKALLDSGVAFARAYQLSPGVSLSAEQMALLTTDIVWLTTQTVTLPSGQKQQVLVPQVYLKRPAGGDLQPSGALIAANDIYIKTAGDLVNSGTIAGQNNTVIDAGGPGNTVANILNRGTISGNNVFMRASNDLTNSGGSILGTGNSSNVTLLAGRDIVLQTTTQSSSVTFGASGLSTRTNIDRVATVQGGNVTLAAGRDMLAVGAQVAAGGDLVVSAKRDLTITGVQTGYTFNTDTAASALNAGRDATNANKAAEVNDPNKISTADILSGKRVLAAGAGFGGGGTVIPGGGRSSYLEEIRVTNNASTFAAGGNQTLVAGNALGVTGSNLAAGNDLTVQGASVSIAAAIDRAKLDNQSSDTSKSSSGYNRAMRDNETLSGGQLSGGNNVTLRATGNATPSTATPSPQPSAARGEGANSGDVSIRGGAITAGSGTTAIIATGNVDIGTLETKSATANESFSMSSGMMSSSMAVKNNFTNTTTANGSEVTGRNVVIQAGDAKNQASNVTITGSQIAADKNVSISASKDVTIAAATNTQVESSYSKVTSSGFDYQGGLSITYGNKSAINKADGTSTTQGDAKSSIGAGVSGQGGNISITSGGTYRQVGSELLAGGERDASGKLLTGAAAQGGDISITAKEVQVLEGRDKVSASQSSKTEQNGLTLALSTPVTNAVQGIAAMSDAASKTSNSRMKAMAAASAAMQIKDTAQALASDPKAAASVSVSITYGQSKSESESTQKSDSATGSKIGAEGNVTIKALGDDGKGSGNITLQGTQVSGNDISLDAKNNVNLLASNSTSEQHSKNSSSSSSVGLAITMGSGGMSMGVTASASLARGRSDGSDSTYTNTAVNAANNLTIKSGGDTNLIGATAAGKSVTANVGGNLNIESLQDTAKFDSKQTSVSASVTVGAGFSGSLSASQTKINSNYSSVGVQSGIRAGDGGFNINVQGATDLKGGAITSTQAAVDGNKNSLTTASLTTSDLQNQAAFKASSISISVGSSGGGGGVGNKSGDANSTTQSGISGGSITIGGKTTDTAKGAPLLDSSGKAINTAAKTGDAETGIKKIFNQQAVEADVAAQVAITKSFGQQASKAVGDYGASKTKPIDDANRFNDLNKRRGSLSEGEAKQLAAMEANGFTPTTAQAALDNPQNQADYAAWKEGGPMRVAAHALVGGITGGNLSSAAGAATSQAIVPILGEQIASLNIPQGLKSTLIQAAGIAVGAATGGVGGAVTAQNATANNYLKHTQWKDLSKELQECKAKGGDCQKIIKDYEATSIAQDKALIEACKDLNSAACRSMNVEAQEGTNTRNELAQQANSGITLPAVQNDWQARARLVQTRVDAQDVVNQCAANPAQCNQQRLQGSVNLLATAVVAGGITIAAVALAPELIAMSRLGPKVYCELNPVSCLAMAEAAAGIATGANVPSVVPGGVKAVGSGGTANAASAQALRVQLAAENIAAIAAQDARLAKAASGSGTANPNFNIGTATSTEANGLGQIWVGDGARPLTGVSGGLISADGTRVYRPPTEKPNTPVQFNPTGVQANFQTRDANTGAVISNGHMVIK